MTPRRRFAGRERPSDSRRGDPSSGGPRQAAAAQQQWLYGRHAVTAALANPARAVLRLLALPETQSEAAALLSSARTAQRPAAPEIVERRVLAALLPEGAVHQGLAVETRSLAAADFDSVLEAIPEAGAPHILLLLDQVTDPHNVGAILRSAAAFGALAVIVPQHGAPPATGALAKAASGALETVPLLRVTNLNRAIERLKTNGFWCIGLDSDAETALPALDLPDRIALVLGAEGAGLRRLVREHCDYLARLPTRGALHSLNVSNAAAVALYALTQRSR